MANHLLLLSIFILVALVSSGSVDASISPEAYWKLKLPYTPMPEFIHQLLGSDTLSSTGEGLDINKVDYILQASYGDEAAAGNKKRVHFNNQKSKQGLAYVGYDGLLSYKTIHDHSTQLKDRFFFVEKDLYLGKKMSLHFQKSTEKGKFLPREVSNKIPFSSDKIDETLEILSLGPKSKEAYVLSKRMELCEEPTIKGIEKQCVTSLESMVDYIISKIGTNVNVLTTQVEKDSKMEYTIQKVEKLVKNDHETIVCHKMGYPYAIFFCHRTDTLRSYMVSLVGKDGSKIEAVAACHKESNDFLDKYAKNVLKVVPGSTHICHFPPAEDTFIWVPKY